MRLSVCSIAEWAKSPRNDVYFKLLYTFYNQIFSFVCQTSPPAPLLEKGEGRLRVKSFVFFLFSKSFLYLQVSPPLLFQGEGIQPARTNEFFSFGQGVRSS